MDFYLVNDNLDKQIAEIKLKIKLSMNGVIAEQLDKNGLKYKKNYGVSIPRIKEIASLYQPNHDLAQRLWSLKVRETMIMASLLEPTEKFKLENAQAWLKDITQNELVEQSCMNLFSKLSYADELCLQCISSENIWTKITGFTLAARIYSKLQQEIVNVILTSAFEHVNSHEYHLYKAISLCLGRFSRIDKMQAIKIINLLDLTPNLNNPGLLYIKEEVNQEILFFYDKLEK